MRQISIVIPGLYPLVKTLPAWQKLISGATTHASLHYHLLIAELCRLNPLPLAAISASYYQLPASSHWLKATPISIATDQNSAYILNASLQLSKQEIQLLTTDLNQLFFQDGLIFHVSEDELLLELTKPLEVTTSPLYEIINKNVAEYLPKGSNKSFWHKLFIEVQMFLYQHPLNRAREQKLQPTISALWFWGEAELPISVPSIPWQILYSDTSWLKHYAAFAAIEFHSLAKTSPLPTDLLATQLSCLVIMEHFLWEPTIDSPQLLEQCMALLSQLKNQPKTEITLYPGDGNCYHLFRQDSWWQRFKTLIK